MQLVFTLLKMHTGIGQVRGYVQQLVSCNLLKSVVYWLQIRQVLKQQCLYKYRVVQQRSTSFYQVVTYIRCFFYVRQMISKNNILWYVLLLNNSGHLVKFLPNIIEMLFQVKCQIDKMGMFDISFLLIRVTKRQSCSRQFVLTSLPTEWHRYGFPVSRRVSSSSQTLRILVDLFSLVRNSTR